MRIELTHVGEELVAAMLESLYHRNALSLVICDVSGRMLTQDIEEERVGDVVHFRAEDANLIVHTGELMFSCDGEQKVDVLCAGESNAIAFEAKLSLERMGSVDASADPVVSMLRFLARRTESPVELGGLIFHTSPAGLPGTASIKTIRG